MKKKYLLLLAFNTKKELMNAIYKIASVRFDSLIIFTINETKIHRIRLTSICMIFQYISSILRGYILIEYECNYLYL